jgi:hypothetical protein
VLKIDDQAPQAMGERQNFSGDWLGGCERHDALHLDDTDTGSMREQAFDFRAASRACGLPLTA